MLSFECFQYVSILLALVCVAVVLFRRRPAKKDDYWEKRGIPYAPTMSIFSTIKEFGEKPFHEIVMDKAKKYGKLFGTMEAGRQMLSVADPDLLRDIFVKDFNIFPFRRAAAADVGDPLIDNMLIVLTGEDWKRVRTVITPAFTSKRMRQMSSIINDCSKSVADVLEIHGKTGEPVDSRRLFAAFIMDVIASAAFGTKIDSYSDPNNEFLRQAKKNMFELTTWMLLLISFVPMSFLKYLGAPIFSSMGFFASLTRAVIKKRKDTGERHNDVLQILIDAADKKSSARNSELNADEEDRYGSIINKETDPQSRYKTISEDELMAQCTLFFSVGYETSASVLTFVAYSLAANPEWQERVIEEIDGALKKHSEINYDSIADMKILDAVVSETLRLYPPLIMADRVAVEDYNLGNTGLTIEKGTPINIPIYAIHHDPDNFEDPEKFDPTRFMDASQRKHHPYAYLPFGAGPRNCLGMRFALFEIKLCIANMLRLYRLGLHSTTKTPLQFKKRCQSVSVTELPLSVEKRTDVQI